MKITLFLLRLALGWVFLYAGLSKLMNASWSAAGYLGSATTFPELYQWFASSQNIGWVNTLNAWGLTLVGAALILGVALRFASYGGILLMMLYYFPVLHFPYVGKTAYLVDEHIMYILVFVLLISAHAGRIWGLDHWLRGSRLTTNRWTRWMFS